jgi:hypothetical protein
VITGGVKFFEQNAAGLVNGGSVVDLLGTGSTVVRYLIGKSRDAYWSSMGSNDTVTETLILTYPESTRDRLIVVGHNWKQFTAQYWNGAAFADFTGVRGMDGALPGGISETAFADPVAYYEVNPFTSTQVRFTATKTQLANEQKRAVFLIVTSELGTLQGFPKISPGLVQRNSRQMAMPSGKKKIVKSGEVFDCTLDFSPYSSNDAYTGDLDLMYALHDRDLPFLMWPCGGKRGLPYFKYAFRPMRLQDIFLAQLVTDISALYADDIYMGPVDLGQLEFAEHV